MIEAIIAGIGVFIIGTWLRTENRLARIETKLSLIEKNIQVYIKTCSAGDSKK